MVGGGVPKKLRDTVVAQKGYEQRRGQHSGKDRCVFVHEISGCTVRARRSVVHVNVRVGFVYFSS